MDSLESAFQKGLTYKEMGLMKEAVAEFQHVATEAALRYRATREIAACLASLGRDSEAEKAFLLSLCSGDVSEKDRLRAWADLADLYERTGRVAHALERLWQIKNLQPDFFHDLTERIDRLRALVTGFNLAEPESCDVAVNADAGSPKQDTPTSELPKSPTVADPNDPRRRTRRVRVSSPVQYSFDQTTWSTGYTTDLSVGGMFVLTHSPVPVGSLVFMRFHIPVKKQQTRVEIIGQAVRQESAMQQKEGVLGMGVQFVSMEDELKTLLTDFVEQLQAEEREAARKAAKIRFPCDTCGKILTAAESNSGDLVKCSCGASATVPYSTYNPSPENPLRGYVLAGCRIDAVIGKGSVATVYKAHHLTLDIPVAIKVLNPALKASGSQMAKNFLKEARVIVKMNHPNIVGVMNAGEEDTHTFILMQYVPGRSLGAIIREGEMVTVNDFVRIFLDVCYALGKAAEHSVVHRDVKPDNILLTPGGKAMLVDFGLVKDLTVYTGGETGLALGTPLYMSPEQATGQDGVDFRSDIYSVGATMYHALAGRPPFQGLKPSTVVRKHIREPLRPLSQIAPYVPARISDMISKAMCKKPDDRFQSADDLKQELLKISGELAAAHYKPLTGNFIRKRLLGKE